MFHRLQPSLPDVSVLLYPTNSASEIPQEVWRFCDILYTERALPDLILSPNLKWIQFHYAGIDNAVKWRKHEA